MQPNFTKPKVLIPKNPEHNWCVWFRYNGKLYRYKKGINYIKNKSERLIEAKILAEAIRKKLKEGWNPEVSKLPARKNPNQFTIAEALDFAFNKKSKNLADKTKSGYQCTIRFVKKAISDLGYDFLPIKETKRVHVKEILEHIQNFRQLSNNAYNQHLAFLQAVLSELIQWDIIEVNPAHKIKKLPTEEKFSNKPANQHEHEKIKTHLQFRDPNFYLFIMSIFHTGIRPKELLLIQIKMIDLKAQEIKLPPEITKTAKERIVPINNHFIIHLKKHIESHDPKPDYYLFGSHRTPGTGNLGSMIDFIPGPTKIKRDTATYRWQKLIKKELQINVNMYSTKHAGANAKIIAGMNLDSLRELYGHTSKLMTEKYATVIKEIHRKQIMDNSPDF